MPVTRREAVEPSHIDVSALHFVAAQHLQQKRFVGSTAFDDDDTLTERAPETGQRLFAGLTIADHLGDHGIKLVRNAVAFRDAGVDAYAGTGHYAETFEDARGGREIVVRVFRIEAHLNRVTESERGITLKTFATRNVKLQFHQIESSGAFGDRMLHLQAGIHFHEEELPGVRIVEELHGASIGVARGLAQANRGFTEVLILLGRKHRRRRLFENFLVPPLNCAIAHTGSPHGSEIVSDDLDLDVAGSLD